MFGAAAEHRAAAQVVRPRRLSSQRFLHRVSAAAQQSVGAQQVPSFGQASVLLAHVDAICTYRLRQVRPVVDQERNAVPAAQGVQFLCLLEDERILRLLLPQLHTGDPCFEQGLHHLRQSLPRFQPAAVSDGI